MSNKGIVVECGNDDENEYQKWGDRATYLMVVLGQFVGVYASTGLAGRALDHGGFGNIILYTLIFVIIGIPQVYLEMVVSQFTGRDCIDVWRARPLLSHVGYILVCWQIFILICNHMYSSFILHYFIITFEYHIPYYVCGHWADEKCDIVQNNYTVNKDCVSGKQETRYDYCASVHVTFPESQYWTNNVMQLTPSKSFWMSTSWRAIIASAILCSVIYVSCFKRKVASRWFLYFITFYPFCGYMVVLFGAMLQKGVVANFPLAIDAGFHQFVRTSQPLVATKHVMYTLMLGSGLTMTVAGGGGFRAHVLGNSVLPIVAMVAHTVLFINVLAMAACPYSFENNCHPYDILSQRQNLLVLFEKIPRLIHFFSYWRIWLLLIYSSNVLMGLRLTIMMFHSLRELASTRSALLAHYPGLGCLAGVLLLFLVTAPIMNHVGMHILILSCRRYISLASVFVALLEICVFVFWYGMNKLAEDIHFMQGVKPSSIFKVAWVLNLFILGYVFVTDLQKQIVNTTGMVDLFGLSLLATVVCGICGGAVLRAGVAWWRGRLRDALQLDAAWGPQSELLRRSRAMFTAQAMTKEYLYRQYHLQAGVAARQRRSNVRACTLRSLERRTTFM